MASPLIERFLERPRGQKAAFWALSIGLIVFLFWQYAFGPVNEKRETLTRDRDSLKTQISSEERILRNLPRVRKEIAALESLRQVALNQLPKKNEMGNLLSSVTGLAKDSGLEVVRFDPGDEQVREYYVEVPVQIEFLGSFQQMMTFFDELSRLARIVSISSIGVQNPRGFQEQAQVSVEGSCRLITYRHLEESEMITVADEDQFRRGKTPPAGAKGGQRARVK